MTAQDALIASALITAVLALAGVIYTQRTAKHSTDQSGVITLRGQDLSRIETLEQQVKQLWEARQADAKRHARELAAKDAELRQRDDHIDVLENHIWTRKPPPPPARSY